MSHFLLIKYDYDYFSKTNIFFDYDYDCLIVISADKLSKN